MRKVFLEDLPYGGFCIPNNRINWKESIGKKVKFIYDDIEGEVEIVDYKRINKTGYLDVKYKDTTASMFTGTFTSCCLATLLKKFGTNNFIHEVGSTLKIKTGRVKIEEQIYVKTGKEHRKGYIYKCLECGDNNTVTEAYLKRSCCGCATCSNKKVIKGINDIATTHPYYTKYFINIEDTYNYSFGSNAVCTMTCPNCGLIKEFQISDLNTRGFSCPKCGDGVSYPNKFIFNVLEQLDIDFNCEKTFDWSNNKRYDFYIPLIGIIEAHGAQHYIRSFHSVLNNSARTLEEEQENDKIKEQLAKDNNIVNYITIDCRRSELYFIKNSIMNSQLSKLFDLSKIDWLRCHEYACNSLVKKACEIKRTNPHMTATEIGNAIALSPTTIRHYLVKGSKLGWCNYSHREKVQVIKIKKQERNVKLHNIKEKNDVIKIQKYKNPIYKQVVLLNTGEIFKSIALASQVSKATNICQVCLDKSLYSGIGEQGEYLQWQYYKDFIDKPKKLLTNKQIDLIIYKNKVKNKKQVVCLNTGEIFDSLSVAGNKYKISSLANIVACCKGKRTYTGINEISKEYLQWQYYNDYLINPKIVLSNKEIDRFNLLKQKKNGSNNGGKNKRKVICLNTKRIFNSAKEAVDFYKISSSGVTAACNPKDRKKSAGKHPETGEPLKWMYYEEYVKQFGEPNIHKEVC